MSIKSERRDGSKTPPSIGFVQRDETETPILKSTRESTETFELEYGDVPLWKLHSGLTHRDFPLRCTKKSIVEIT